METKDTTNSSIPAAEIPAVETPAVENASPALQQFTESTVLDLTTILTIPTQKRDEVSTAILDESDNTPVSTSTASFDTEKVEAIKDTTATLAQATVTSSYDTDKLADALIDLGDTILTHSAPYIYESLLTPDERKGMKDLAKRYRKAQIEKQQFVTTDQDAPFIQIQVDIEDYEKLMELSEAEKASIKEPLKELLKNVNFTASPQNSLLMACAMVAVPRIIPLIPMVMRKFFPKSNASVNPITFEIKKLSDAA